MATTPTRDPDVLRAEISARYGALSRRLQQIAHFAMDHPDDMALKTIAVIAERAGVQPSALIRFAKTFGYNGFSDMQKVFQAHLVKRPSNYAERVRLFRKQRKDGQLNLLELLGEFVVSNVFSLEHLQERITAEHIEQAVELLANAREIHIIGLRRSFPVATYMAYAFSHFDRYVHLLDGVGGMLFEQAWALSPLDVLVAISSHPYAPETAEVISRAKGKGVPMIAITDSPLSPIAEPATVCFEIPEAEVCGFRSLTASMCMAQTLVVGLGIKLDRDA